MTLVSELEETHQHWLDMHLKSGEFSLFNTLGFFQGEKKKLGGKSLSSNLTAAKPHLGSNHSLRSEELRFPTQGATALYSSFLLCFYSQPKHDCASCNGSRILFFYPPWNNSNSSSNVSHSLFTLHPCLSFVTPTLKYRFSLFSSFLLPFFLELPSHHQRIWQLQPQALVHPWTPIPTGSPADSPA